MLELIVPDTGGLRRGESVVSISGKFKRILLYKQAYDEMKLGHGQDFDYVQFWGDKEHPDRFWMRPAAKGNTGTARIVLNPGNGTKTISAAHLLKFLDWRSDRSVRCSLEWDTENKAAVVMMKHAPG